MSRVLYKHCNVFVGRIEGRTGLIALAYLGLEVMPT